MTKAAVSAPNPARAMSVENAGLHSPKIAGRSEIKPNAFSSEVDNRERIALLAYSYWVDRGCQGGSPEEDWFRAEREIAPAS